MKFLFLFCLVLCSATAQGAPEKSVVYDQKSKNIIFIFKSDRGDVRFNHDLHVAEMKKESCIPCHQADSPTKENKMSRFDQRLAHYFCKGCHREKGRGPTECHECHRHGTTR